MGTIRLHNAIIKFFERKKRITFRSCEMHTCQRTRERDWMNMSCSFIFLVSIFTGKAFATQFFFIFELMRRLISVPTWQFSMMQQVFCVRLSIKHKRAIDTTSFFASMRKFCNAIISCSNPFIHLSYKLSVCDVLSLLSGTFTCIPFVNWIHSIYMSCMY